MASLRPFSLFVAPLALAFAVLAVGCGSGNDVTGGATGPTTLEITDLTVGTGAEAKNGDILSVHYIGSFLNGQVFESSYPGGTPFSFTLGAGRVITGWDRGIVGMRVGGKRRLVIPANLAYGSSGSGIIPPNTPLQFDVELVSIQGK